MNDNELKHYGVLGMKWGKRKARYESKIESDRSHNIKRINENIRATKAKKNKINTQFNNHEITKKQADRALLRLNNRQKNQELAKEKIKKSKYGKSNFEIISEGIVQNTLIRSGSNIASRVAAKRGQHAVEAAIQTIGQIIVTGNRIKTGYKVFTN